MRTSPYSCGMWCTLTRREQRSSIPTRPRGCRLKLVAASARAPASHRRTSAKRAILTPTEPASVLVWSRPRNREEVGTVDPVGCLVGWARILFMPVLLPWKLVKSLLTTRESQQRRFEILRARCYWLLVMFRAYGYDPLSADTRLARGQSVSEYQFANLFWMIQTAYEKLLTYAGASRLSTTINLDYTERHLDMAVRIAINLLVLDTGIPINERLPYRGTWRPRANWALSADVDSNSFPRKRMDDQLQTVLSLRLAQHIVIQWVESGMTVDDPATRAQIGDYVNRINYLRDPDSLELRAMLTT
jgi:hypothetical protein